MEKPFDYTTRPIRYGKAREQEADRQAVDAGRQKQRRMPRLLSMKENAEALLKWHGERLSSDTVDHLKGVIRCMQKEIDKK